MLWVSCPLTLSGLHSLIISALPRIFKPSFFSILKCSSTYSFGEKSSEVSSNHVTPPVILYGQVFWKKKLHLWSQILIYSSYFSEVRFTFLILFYSFILEETIHLLHITKFNKQLLNLLNFQWHLTLLINFTFLKTSFPPFSLPVEINPPGFLPTHLPVLPSAWQVLLLQPSVEYMWS